MSWTIDRSEILQDGIKLDAGKTYYFTYQIPNVSIYNSGAIIYHTRTLFSDTIIRGDKNPNMVGIYDETGKLLVQFK